MTRDHGGGIDAAAARWGGARSAWLDLSTGINPVPYRVTVAPDAWTALPDRAALERLITAARRFWSVPDSAAVLAAPGASALIAQMPAALGAPARVAIPGPTYNEHEAAFAAAGWQMGRDPDAMVVVHPNNPDGRLWQAEELTAPICIIDESFCDIVPERSLMAEATRPGTVILKSFGKFWGLAGARLGFAIGDPQILARLATALGPWAVSGPALSIGADALEDAAWAAQTRARLAEDSQRMDALMTARGAQLAGGTPLFRLYRVEDATQWQDHLARSKVLTRVFPYDPHWLRLGLPAPDRWDQFEKALSAG
ncbi:MAG: threonine-phosphate decarboxylase [Rhodobacterales bacterium]|nr:MAG: threonine-phosphate decarboxylase [Rhodobacterales bacterium]